MRKLIGMLALIAAASLGFTAQAAEPFKLSSADLKPGGTVANEQVFKGFGCEGGNVSPQLSWSGAPAGTKSFAVLVHDPDAPTGGAGWWHWAVIDIAPTVHELPKGAGASDGSKLPPGARQIKTDFGTPGWGGPCPPPGDRPHHYHITVYALKVPKLDVPADATASLVGYMVLANSIGKARLTGVYGRK